MKKTRTTHIRGGEAIQTAGALVLAECEGDGVHVPGHWGGVSACNTRQ
jgi:hypothetical protein